MKKIIASLAAVALAAALCCAFVSAAETSGTGPADTNVAQGKTYTTTTAAYGDDENAFYLDEAGIKLTDGIIGDKVPVERRRHMSSWRRPPKVRMPSAPS